MNKRNTSTPFVVVPSANWHPKLFFWVFFLHFRLSDWRVQLECACQAWIQSVSECFYGVRSSPFSVEHCNECLRKECLLLLQLGDFGWNILLHYFTTFPVR